MICNLMNRRAALREMKPGQTIIWAVTAASVTLEMRLLADAAAKVGAKVKQQHMISVSPRGDELPVMTILIERIE